MKIGVLGGTFDPPHNGHIEFALAAIDRLGLDEVQLLPNSRNPLKAHRSFATSRQRLEMLELATSGHEKLAVCDIEIQKGGLSYTYDTMSELTFAIPGEYWFLAGIDAAASLEEWKKPQKLVKLCRLGVALRPPFTETQIKSKIPEFAKPYLDLIPMKPMDVSSRQIREDMSDGVSVKKHLDSRVLEYIKKNKLYL